jgi:serine/threonine protein phosphatase PrpC
MTCVRGRALQSNRALPLQSPDERAARTLCCDAVAEEIGVTGVAEMASYTLKEETAFLVLATDGVWEFLTSQSVVDLVSREGTVISCCTLQQLAGPRSGCL